MSDSGPPYGGDERASGTDLEVDPGRVKDEALWVVGLDLLSPETRRRLVAVAGVVSLLSAILLVAIPWLPGWVTGPFLPLLLFLPVAGQAGVIVVGLVGAGIGLVALYRKTGTEGSSSPEVEVPTLPRNRRAERTVDPPGQRLDTLVERVSGDAEDPSRGVNRRVDKRQVRKQLRDVAVEVLHDRYALSAEEARTAVDEGTWSESRRASGFVGGPEAPRPRLSTRIRDWASGDPFERRVHATADEIARVGGVPGHERLLDAPMDRTNHTPPWIAREETGAEPTLDLDRPGATGVERAATSSGTDRDATGEDDEPTAPDTGDDEPTTGELETERSAPETTADAGPGTGGGPSADWDPGPTEGSPAGDEPSGDEVPDEWVEPGDGSGRGEDPGAAGDRGPADGGESP